MAIFVDEAGFTGPDLLNADQPFFVLSSISIEATEADAILHEIKTDYKINATELKAKNLIKTSKGKKAIATIVSRLNGKFALSCNHKVYNLCCKFFEYIFEPVLQRNNSLFYEKKFHLFIANLLFIHVITQEQLALDILLQFRDMIKKKDINALQKLFLNKPGNKDILFESMITFIEGYIDEIAEELNIIGSTDKWVLDLTTSSLSSLLRHWSQTIPELTVYCDSSKPLEASKTYFDVMVGRTDKPIIQFPGGKEFCPIFNMKQPLTFLNSASSAGIQLADILAGTAMLALRDGHEDFVPMLEKGNIEESVFPTLENVDSNSKGPFLNSIVLLELADRSRKGFDPIFAMKEYYSLIEQKYEVDPPI